MGALSSLHLRERLALRTVGDRTDGGWGGAPFPRESGVLALLLRGGVGPSLWVPALSRPLEQSICSLPAARVTCPHFLAGISPPLPFLTIINKRTGKTCRVPALGLSSRAG